MDPFLNPDLPAPAKVLSLVRLHHGLQSGKDEEIPVTAAMRGNHVARFWKSGARLNHLAARRRRIALEDIPTDSFPVILELEGGTNFILLKEKHEEDTYIVQFPDSREAAVQGERIREIYDGNCVFLRRRESLGSGPGSSDTGVSRRRGVFQRFRSRISSLPLKRGLFAAVATNLVTLGVVMAMLYSHGTVLRQFEASPLVLPAMAVLLAGAVVLGILRLRRETLTEPVSAAIVDCCFALPFGLAIFILAGWSAMPFLWMAGMIVAALVLSNRLGGVPSRIREARNFILALTFTGAAVGTWLLVALGLLHPALMAGVIVFGTCFVNLFIESDVLWQEYRLALIR